MSCRISKKTATLCGRGRILTCNANPTRANHARTLTVKRDKYERLTGDCVVTSMTLCRCILLIKQRPNLSELGCVRCEHAKRTLGQHTGIRVMSAEASQKQNTNIGELPRVCGMQELFWLCANATGLSSTWAVVSSD